MVPVGTWVEAVYASLLEMQLMRSALRVERVGGGARPHPKRAASSVYFDERADHEEKYCGKNSECDRNDGVRTGKSEGRADGTEES